MASFGSSGRFGGTVPAPRGTPSKRLTPAETKQVRSKLKAAAYSKNGVDWHKLFRHYDRSNNGELGVHEFKRALRNAHITPSMLANNQIRHLFNTIDLDNGGTIDVEEFITWVEGGNDDVDAQSVSSRRSRRPRSSGYGRRSPVDMASPSQRRFDIDRGVWLNNNDEHSTAEGAGFRNFDSPEADQFRDAIHNATIALKRPPGSRRKHATPERAGLVPAASSSPAAASPPFTSLARKKAPVSTSASASRTELVHRVKELEQEREANAQLIRSQAEQLQLLKMMVGEQYDALSPHPDPEKAVSFANTTTTATAAAATSNTVPAIAATASDSTDAAARQQRITRLEGELQKEKRILELERELAILKRQSAAQSNLHMQHPHSS